MLALVSFLIILCVVLLLLNGKVLPSTAMTLIPIIGAILAGFSFVEISSFFNYGLHKVISVAVMFIFAILYFGIMQDAGLFTPLVRFVLKIAKSNVIAISIGTVIIAAIAHLDGSGASTFLITIPMLLPIYRELKMSPYLLVLLIGASASIMNMVPWAGPLGRVASVLNVNPTILWKPLILVQVLGIAFLLFLTIILALREKNRIKNNFNVKNNLIQKSNSSLEETQQKTIEVKSKKTISLISSLVIGILPIALNFIIAVSIALPLNHRKTEEQLKAIKSHASGALMMALIIISAGVFLGILEKSGMLSALANELVHILPSSVVSHLSIIVGIFGVPSKMILNTDAYFFGLLPLVSQVGVSHGVSAQTTSYLMLTGDVPGTFISPFSPALWLAMGLAGIDMGKYIKYSFLWVWSIGLFCLAMTYLFVL